MTPRHPLGQILRDDDSLQLRYQRDLSHPPERVWRALTESDQLRHWMPCDIIGPRQAGAELSVVFWDDIADKHGIDEPVLTGRIVTWDPPRCFAWTWDDELLTFDLAPLDGGTRLTLTVRLSSKGPGAALAGAGYHTCLDQLVALVETDNPPPFIDQDGSRYEPDYAALVDRLG